MNILAYNRTQTSLLAYNSTKIKNRCFSVPDRSQPTLALKSVTFFKGFLLKSIAFSLPAAPDPPWRSISILWNRPREDQVLRGDRPSDFGTMMALLPLQPLIHLTKGNAFHSLCCVRCVRPISEKTK